MEEDVIIDSKTCFVCGQPFGQGHLKKTRHHAIPVALGPAKNATIPVHEDCHKKINGLYVVQQKKTRAPRPLKVFGSRIQSLSISYNSFGKKIEQLVKDFDTEIQAIEKGEPADKADK